MKGLLKKWARRRRESQQRRHDFSENIRRAERREKLRQFGPIRWMRKASAAVFRFREPKWAASRPMTKRGTTRLALARGSYFNPLVWIWGLVRFLASWIVSRPYGSVLPAVPAIAVLLGIVGLVFWYRSAGRNWRDTMYRGHLNSAVQRQDLPVALVSVNALIDQNPNDPELRFQRALINKELGHDQMCDHDMQQLVFTSKHVPAMFWVIAHHFDGGLIRNWEQEKQTQYARLLAELLTNARGAEVTAAKKLMGTYLSQRGAAAEALTYLAEIAADNPDLLIPVALLNRQVGNENGARQFANQAREHFASLLAARPQDTNLRIQLAQAMSLAEDLEASIRLLREGLLIAPDPQITAALAEALAIASIQFDGDDRLSTKELARRFEYAGQALQLAPTNITVLDAVVVILTETRANPDRQTLHVRETLLAGLSPEVTHFIEGTIAILDDQFDKAVKHLRLANAHGLNTGAMMNNLAFALAEKEGADLNEALRLAEGAHELLPNHPYVLETRGKILLKMKRYEEAVRDLEKALVEAPLRPQIYPSLAIAYAELGLEHKASDYQQLAEESERMIALAEAKRAEEGEATTSEKPPR